MIKSQLLILLLSTLMMPFSVHSKERLRVAVASNFAATAALLFRQYESQHDVEIITLVGSTGKHVGQIQHGLYVDVFLAADRQRPQWLELNGLSIKGSRFTYALGRLALYSLNAKALDDFKLDRSVESMSLAIANPKLAPYGVAALKYLDDKKISKSSAFKIVKGESVAQAFQFAASGAADLALIAWSQVRKLDEGYFYLIPSEDHSLIEQQAVLIHQTELGSSFMGYLQSDAALKIIQDAGYLRP